MVIWLLAGVAAAIALAYRQAAATLWLGAGLVLLGFVVHLLGGRLRWFKPQSAT